MSPLHRGQLFQDVIWVIKYQTQMHIFFVQVVQLIIQMLTSQSFFLKVMTPEPHNITTPGLITGHLQ